MIEFGLLICVLLAATFLMVGAIILIVVAVNHNKLKLVAIGGLVLFFALLFIAGGILSHIRFAVLLAQ